MATQMNSDEYEAFQVASDQYQPELTGPLVSEREPSSVIVEEYAKADPIYRTKTSVSSTSSMKALISVANRRARPSKTPTIPSEDVAAMGAAAGEVVIKPLVTPQSILTVQNIAISFGYFESLLDIGKLAKYEAELGRMNSLNNLLGAGGFEGIYDDFAVCTTDLLEQFVNPSSGTDLRKLLLETFNDESTSGCIIYHFRLLASAWMKANPDDFMPYLDMPVDQYCKSQIEIPSVELDQPGIRALVDVVYKDAGLGLEIVYLDRSVGTEANVITHSTAFVDVVGPDVAEFPTVRLLYRPGHYDIIYKHADILVSEAA